MPNLHLLCQISSFIHALRVSEHSIEHKLAIALKKIMKSESQYSKTHLVFLQMIPAHDMKVNFLCSAAATAQKNQIPLRLNQSRSKID